MTEDDAKTKACCGPCVSHRPLSIVDDQMNKVPRCVGSACMAWRWAFVFDAPTDETVVKPSIGYGRSDKEGYCGIAGSPT